MPLTSLLQDPNFTSLPPGAQLIVGKKQLATEDPNFAALPEGAKDIAVRKLLNLQPTTTIPVSPSAPILPRPTFTQLAGHPWETTKKMVKGIPGDIGDVASAAWTMGKAGFLPVNSPSNPVNNIPSLSDIVGNIGSKIFSGPYGATHGTPEQGKQVSAMLDKNFGTPGKALGTVAGSANQLGGDVLNTLVEHPVSSYLTGKVAGAVVPAITSFGAAGKADMLERQIVKEVQKGMGGAKIVKPDLYDSASWMRYFKDSKAAVIDVVKNKESLVYTDFEGNVTAQGRLPRTVQEFSQAVSQRKKELYKAYHGVLVRAGEGGTPPLIDNAPIVEELVGKWNPATNKYDGGLINKTSVKQRSPELIEAAQEMAERLRATGNYTGKMTLEEAEDAIARGNAIADTHYKSTVFKDNQKGMIEALVNKMQNEQIDKIIAGTDYEPLKKAYGAFKGIGKAVGLRAKQVVASPPKGIWDVSDLGTTPMFLHGLATLNWSLISPAVLARFIAHRYKWLNHADTIVAKMFGNVETLEERQQYFKGKQLGGILKNNSGVSPTLRTPTPPIVPTRPTGGITVPGSTFTGAPIPAPPVKMPYTQALIDSQEEPARRMYPNYWRK